MADTWFNRFLSVFFRVYPRSTDLAVSAKVDDSPGWSAFGAQPHDRDISEVQALYADALTAWRKNPIAWRIVSITTDYIVGDRIQITSTNRRLARFAANFWNHPKNHMDLRLETMSDELARSGDLFCVLFRNPADGMSYLRFVTKDRITKIECSENDWENEIAFFETQDTGEPKKWLSPSNPAARDAPAVMMHYAVNRPLGALLGESDLATMLPWLQRYSRMLEDRVRLHWAIRAFLWIVTVPTNQVQTKKEEYRNPPEAGSIIVKDEAETWDVFNPSLQGADASHDMKAVRGMIDSGSGYPPHWRGEAADANLATATAMQAPTERHLLRRQQYFTFVLEDLIYQAYQRAVQSGNARPLATNDYDRLFVVQVPDVSRSDNEALARAAKDIATAMQTLSLSLAGRGKDESTFTKLILKLAFRFAGEPQTDQTLDQIVSELAQMSVVGAEHTQQRP
jgi:hypothetical protein